MNMNGRLDGHETGPKEAQRSVIWLHGLGADCYDFLPIVDELGLSPELQVRFVFPNAPHRRVTLNGGLTMRAWYDLKSLDLDDRSHDQEGILDAQNRTLDLITRERERGVPPERIVLAGFSQGGAVALYTALRYPERLAGLVALSTYLLNPDRFEAELAPANRALPVFLAHGTDDPIVPISAAEWARTHMESKGFHPDWHTYPMPHAVHPQEVQDVGAFLRRVFS